MSEVIGRSLSKSERRRLEILDVAIKVIGEIGGERLTFDSVAKPLGLTRAHIKYYFDDTDEIIDLCLEYMVRKSQSIVSARINEQLEPKAKLKAYVKAQFEWLGSNKAFSGIMLYMFSYASSRASRRKLISQVRAQGFERVRELMATVGHEDMALPAHALVTHQLFYFASGTAKTKKERDQYEKECLKGFEKLIESKL
jgi:AcrR family transcriptional regulator